MIPKLKFTMNIESDSDISIPSRASTAEQEHAAKGHVEHDFGMSVNHGPLVDNLLTERADHGVSQNGELSTKTVIIFPSSWMERIFYSCQTRLVRMKEQHLTGFCLQKVNPDW